MKDTAQTALTLAKRTQARAIFLVLLAGSLWGCIGLFSRTLSALGVGPETICCVSGESIAVEAAIAVKRGNVVAVEYKPGDFQTMEENLVRFGLRNVLIVDDMESYSHRWPVPDVAFLVASPKLETELKTLVHVNPKIRVVIYTLEFSFMSRIPGMLWDNGIKPTEVMKLEVSKLGRKDEIEVQPAPWIFSGQAGLDEA